MFDRTDMHEEPAAMLRIIGANILQLRSDREWTADNLATRMNLDRCAIIDIEAGRMEIDIDQLGELADALEVAAWELLKPRDAR